METEGRWRSRWIVEKLRWEKGFRWGARELTERITEIIPDVTEGILDVVVSWTTCDGDLLLAADYDCLLCACLTRNDYCNTRTAGSPQRTRRLYKFCLENYKKFRNSTRYETTEDATSVVDLQKQQFAELLSSFRENTNKMIPNTPLIDDNFFLRTPEFTNHQKHAGRT